MDYNEQENNSHNTHSKNHKQATLLNSSSSSSRSESIHRTPIQAKNRFFLPLRHQITKKNAQNESNQRKRKQKHRLFKHHPLPRKTKTETLGLEGTGDDGVSNDVDGKFFRTQQILRGRWQPSSAAATVAASFPARVEGEGGGIVLWNRTSV